MEYRWNKYELLIKKTIAILLKNPKALNIFEILLELSDLKHNQVDKDKIMICEENPIIDFNERLCYFITSLYHIPEDLYNDLTDIFTWFQDLSCLRERPVLDKNELTDDDLITLAHDIITSMNNKELLIGFNKLLPKFKHTLNIQAQVLEKTSSSSQELGGVALFDPIFHKNYISIFRKYTLDDVETTTHEFLHAILRSMMEPYYKNSNNVYLLRELEGYYGSQVAIRYLDNIGFKKEAFSMRKSLLYSNITSSYLMMINQILFQTAKNADFNLEKANEYLKNLNLNIKIEILEEELPRYLSISGFDECINLLGYLTSLDLLESGYTPLEATRRMINLKRDDSLEIEKNFDKHGITFHKDGYRNLIKEYKYIKELK